MSRKILLAVVTFAGLAGIAATSQAGVAVGIGIGIPAYPYHHHRYYRPYYRPYGFGVYVAPAPVYYPPPRVYYAPAPGYAAPAPGYAVPAYPPQGAAPQQYYYSAPSAQPNNYAPAQVPPTFVPSTEVIPAPPAPSAGSNL